MGLFSQPIAEWVWETKYRYRQGRVVIDSSIEATWARVANAIAQAETSRIPYWQKQFYHLLEEFKFLPGGRILAGAGTEHQVTLFNCFVMNIAEDSMAGIFTALQEGALTLQQGGGVGYDFSILRPKGDRAVKTGVPASGPVSFMRIWDTMCAVLLSTGARRGAMMGVLRCDHPDIEDFITAKHTPGILRHFNLSVLVSDAFMQAVKTDERWPLVFPASDGLTGADILMRPWGNQRQLVPCRVYRWIKARVLWERLIRSAYDTAEPGVLFEDTINRLNTLSYREWIHATNPCGEIPLPAYGACNLGAINLTQMVIAPWTVNAKLNWALLEEITAIGARFLDNVIDVSRYPLKMQQQQVMSTRRIGLGITGLADALVMLGLSYDSQAGLDLAREIMRRIQEVTWLTSIQLAQEKASFLAFSKDYLNGEFVRGLPEHIQRQLNQYGIRNSHHNTIAPAGTISLLANNVSNGIEPIYAAEYTREVREDEGKREFQVQDYAYAEWKKQHHGTQEERPPHWQTALTIEPQAHLQMQAALQPYIDNAISKTLNIPANFSFDKVQAVYTDAYALHLKGCTIFRPNPTTGSVLTIGGEPCCVN